MKKRSKAQSRRYKAQAGKNLSAAHRRRAAKYARRVEALDRYERGLIPVGIATEEERAAQHLREIAKRR